MTYKNKRFNHLATSIEKQQNSVNNLPKSINQKLSLLNKATKELKGILTDYLPEEIVHSLLVVNASNQHLTLSVPSITAANHMKYIKNNLIDILNNHARSNHVTYTYITELTIIVVENKS